MASDLIRVNELFATVLLHNGAAWPAKDVSKPTEQPVSITITVPHDVRQTAATDLLDYSVNYSSIAKTVRNSISLQNTAFQSLKHLAEHIINLVLHCKDPLVKHLHLKIQQLKGPLHCKHAGVEAEASDTALTSIRYFIEDIECPVVVGINPCERLEPQVVIFNLSISQDNATASNGVDYRMIVKRLYEKVVDSKYFTLEALVSVAASEVLQVQWLEWSQDPTTLVTIRAAKPSALVFAASSEVEIQRKFEDFPNLFKPKGIEAINPSFYDGKMHLAAIALGSNLGDRFQNIEQALRLIEKPQDLIGVRQVTFSSGSEEVYLDVIDTSFMYESAPMYVTDQPAFMNCAAMIKTNISPMDLLQLMKFVEADVGRVPSIRNGPRAVDLDIIFYGDLIMDSRPADERTNTENLTGHLVIPHPRALERPFVLKPLNDMIPDYVHPTANLNISKLLEILEESNAQMKRVIPFPSHASFTGNVPQTLTSWQLRNGSGSMRTQIMGTLNATPDSFSDGSDHNTISSGIDYVRGVVNSGANIIDIGGYSTRPGAAFVSVDEEITRVVPMVTEIRRDADERLRNILISVDTFRPEVAQAAIEAGANCINDVYSFTGPNSYPCPHEEQSRSESQIMKDMKEISRRYAVPVVLMHSRGDAGLNKDYTAYEYAGHGMTVIEGVRVELGAKVEAIVKGKGGVRRWLVIIDPGVGFSKTVEGNLEVLRRACEVVANTSIGRNNDRKRNPLASYPMLIGTSRKSFLGAIISQQTNRSTIPKERGWATAAAVACAIQQKADVVRVHDCQEMADVVRISEALWFD